MADDKACFMQFLPQLNSKDEVTVFDVGANINSPLFDYTEFILSKCSRIVKVHAFEPLHWQSFENKYKDNEKVSLWKLALSDTTEVKTLFSPPSTGLASLYKRSVFKQWEAKQGTVIYENKVQTITLNEFIKLHHITCIDYLKLDAEGEEFNILKGAEECLKNKIIQGGHFECGGTFPDANVKLSALVDFLDSFGYSCHRINLSDNFSNQPIGQDWFNDHIMFKIK